MGGRNKKAFLDGHDKTLQFKPFCPEYIPGQHLLLAPAGSCCQLLLTPVGSVHVTCCNMKNGLCHLKILETRSFSGHWALVRGVAASAEQHSSPLEIPPHGQKGSSRTRQFGDTSRLPLQAPGLCLPAPSTRDGWALPVRCSGQRKGLPAVGARGTASCTRAGEN